MPYLPFGFELVTGQAENLKIASVVGAAVHERNDVVQREPFYGPAAHAHLWKRGPHPLAPTGFGTAAHFLRNCIGMSIQQEIQESPLRSHSSSAVVKGGGEAGGGGSKITQNEV